MFDLGQVPLVLSCLEKAAEAIMAYYQAPRATWGIVSKDDASPVTKADLASHEILSEGLGLAFPDCRIISEEGVLPSWALRQDLERYWLLDPLDGTKGFIKRNGEFCIALAYMYKHEPQLGFIFEPCKNRVYWGGMGLGAWERDEFGVVRALPWGSAGSELRVLASRNHLDAGTREFIEGLAGGAKALSWGQQGAALKFVRLAEGLADCYPRMGPCMLWDTAAGQAIVEGAGGSVRAWPQGRRLAYVGASWEQQAFVAYGPWFGGA